MDVEEACPCDTPEYWEVLKTHFEDQTILLKDKEQELRDKIAQVEALIATHSSSCSCEVENDIPRVFPRNTNSPVRELPTKSSPKCSSGFFQKVMENAKSILTMKCSAIHPSNTNEIPTRDSSCVCDSEERQWTSSSSKGVAFESLPEYSTSYHCLCDEDDTATKNDTTADSYSQEVNNSFSCSGCCQVKTDTSTTKEDTTISTGECSQYTTNSSRSKTPCSLSTGQYTNPASMVSCGCPSMKLPEYPDTVTINKSTAMSKKACQHCVEEKQANEEVNVKFGSCWNNPFQFKINENSDVAAAKKRDATSKNVYSRGMSPCFDKVISSDRKKDVSCRICPSTRDTTTSRSLSRKTSPDRNNPDTKKSSCRIHDCPRFVNEIDTNTETPCTVDTCTSLIHQKVNATSCRIDPFLKPTNTTSRKSVGARRRIPCKDSTCPGLQAISKSFTAPNITTNRRTEKRKSCTIQTCPSSKRIRSRSNIRDIDNQCAFIGSPILNPSNYNGIGDTKNMNADCGCPTSQVISDLNTKEKGYKDHMRELLEREKNYDSVLRNVQNTVNQPTCCCAAHKENSKSDEIKKITNELKLENQILKGEVLEMKYELKHCIENIEGPIKQKLETERLRCEHLQQDLNQASQNMIGNQDSYLRETNSLKLQLCVACSNMTELNSINKRLKEEMKSLDTMCAKLEEDLLKQKLNEADTIRRLTKRTNVGGAHEFPCTGRKFSCDSSLNVIARKLSKTLKESAPCEECSKHPELTGAAKMIKDLTDMVEKRKAFGFSEGLMESKKDCSCQSRRQTEEDSCQCYDFRDIGAGESKNSKGKSDPAKMTKTLFSVSPTFVEKNESSTFNINKGPTFVTAEAQMSDSQYYSAHAQPCFLDTCEDPDSCIRANDISKKWKASDAAAKYPPCPESCEIPAGDSLRATKTHKVEKQQQIPERVTVESEPCTAPCNAVIVDAAPCESIGKPCQTAEIRTRDQDQIDRKEDRSEQIPITKTTGSSTGKEPYEGIQTEEIEMSTQGQGDQILETSSVCADVCEDDAPCESIGKPCQTTEVEKKEAVSGEDKVDRGEDATNKIPREVCGDVQPCEPCVVAGKICQTKFDLAAPTMEEIMETIRRESISSAQEAVKHITDALLGSVVPKIRRESDIPGEIPEEMVLEVPEVKKEVLEVGEMEPKMEKETSSSQAAKMITETLLDKVSVHQETQEKVEIEPDVTEETQKTIYSLDVIKKSAHQSEPSIDKIKKEIVEIIDNKPSKHEHERDIEEGVEEQKGTIEEDIDKVIDSKASKQEQDPTIGDIEKELDSKPPVIKEQEQKIEGILDGEPSDVDGQKLTIEDGIDKVIDSKASKREQEPTMKDIGEELDSKPPAIQKQEQKIEENIGEAVGSQPSIMKEQDQIIRDDADLVVENKIPDMEDSSKIIEEQGQLDDSKISPPTPTPITPSAKLIENQELLSPKITQEQQLPKGRLVDSHAPGELLKEEIQGDFPFEVETTVVALDEPPPGLLVTTTITNSGNLEVITEGPNGIIETTLNYTEDGVIEVITQITEVDDVNDPQTREDLTSSAITEALKESISGSKKPKSETTDRYPESKIQFKKEQESIQEAEYTEGASNQIGSEYTSDKETSEEKSFKMNESSSQRKDTTASMITQYSHSLSVERMSPSPDETQLTPSSFMTDALRKDNELPVPPGVDSSSGRKSEVTTGERLTTDETTSKSNADGMSSAKPFDGVSSRTTDNEDIISSTAKPIGDTVSAIATPVSASGKELKGITPRTSAYENVPSEQVGQEVTLSDDLAGSGQAGALKGDDTLLDQRVAQEEHVQELGSQQESTLPVVGQKLEDISEKSEMIDGEQQTTTGKLVDATASAIKPSGVSLGTARSTKSAMVPIGDRVTEGGVETDEAAAVTKEFASAEEKESVRGAVTTDETGQPISQEGPGDTSGSTIKPSGVSLGAARSTKSAIKDSAAVEDKEMVIGAVTIDETDQPISQEGPEDTRGSTIKPSGVSLGAARSTKSAIRDSASVEDKELLIGAVTIDETGQTISQEVPEASEAKTAETTKKALPRQNKLDCACQSSPPPTEQSCQCCECKDIAVSTSQDTETITEGNMAIDKLSVKEATDAKTGSNYATAGSKDDTGNTKAEALSLEAEKTQGTGDDISAGAYEKSDTDGEEKTGPAAIIESTSKTKNDGGTERIDQSSSVEADSSRQPTPKLISQGQSAISKTEESKCSPTCSTFTNDKKQVSSKELTTQKKSSEVPDSVSKLSDRGMTPVIDSSDTKRPRKKRSSKLENVKCDCVGICQCVVCSPEIISKRVEMTGNTEPPIGESDQLCCCTVQSSQSHPQTTCQVNQVSHMQTLHFANCECTSCKLESCKASSPKYKTEAFLRSTNLDSTQGAIPKTKKRTCLDDIFNPPCQIPADCWKPLKKSTHTHSAECECIDCLCLPKIQKIAQMKEFPIVKDDKQIYQVTTMKCSCINAVNAKKYLAERSRIPIATNSTTVGPPKIKPPTVPECVCEDCDCCPGDCSGKKEENNTPKSEPIKSETVQDNTGQGQKIKLTPSQLAKMCDCEECMCKVCFNKPAEQGSTEADKSLDTKQSQMGQGAAAHPEMCDCSECECKVCFKKPAKQETQESAEPDKPLDIKQSQMDKAKGENKKNCCCKGECTCEVCPVDVLQTKVSIIVPKDLPVSIAPSTVAHGDDCDCQECACPNSAAMKTASDISKTEVVATLPSVDNKASSLPNPEDCDCEVCNCPLSENQNKQVANIVVDSPSHPDDCDCEECVNCALSPGKTGKASAKPSQFSTIPDQIASAKPSQFSTIPDQITTTKPIQSVSSDCKCDLCKCVNAKETQAKGDQSQKPSAIMTTPEDTPIMECDCVKCECDPCADPNKKKPQEPIVTKMMPCDCIDCECDPCADPSKQKPQSAKKVDLEKGDAKVIADLPTCTCEICDCPGNDGTKTFAKDPHPDDCDCADCLCAEEIMQTASEFSQKGKTGHPEGCICVECKCPGINGEKSEAHPEPSTDKGAHPPGCICEKCLCAHGTSQGHGCSCVECTCTDCFYKNERAVDTLSCKCGDCACKDCSKMDQTGDGSSKVRSTQKNTKDYPEGCTCAECKCPGLAGTRSEAQPGPTTVEATHPPGCNCGKCLCSQETSQGKGCCCVECTCTDCFYKNERTTDTPDCKCGDCVCKECSKMGQTGDGTSRVRSMPTGGTESGHKTDECACGECVCTDCFYKKEKSETKECKCGVCTCHDCQFNVQIQEETKKQDASVPAVTTRSCHCIDCACDVCSKEDRKKKVDKLTDTTKLIETLEPVKTATHPEGCTCLTCLCIECFTKTKNEPSSKEGTIKPASSVRSPNCKCIDCVCEDCCSQDIKPIVESATQICHCDDCKCDDCVLKKSQAVLKSPTEAGKTSTPCQCTECKDDCLKEGPSGWTCHCPGCGCDDCSSKEKKPPSSGQSKKPIEQSTATGLDPPRFEVPIRKSCDCNTCTCVICEQKKQIIAGFTDGFPSGKTPLATNEAPPFEVPIRLPCSCAVCTCVVCNKEGTVGASGPRSAAVTGTTPPATLEAPPFEAAIRIPCNCGTCTCTHCNKEGGQLPSSVGGGAQLPPSSGGVGASGPRSAATTNKMTPATVEAPPFEAPIRLPCDCGKCTCPYCNKEGNQLPPPIGVGVQKSFAVGDKKSAAVGIPCNCLPCECFESDKRGNQPAVQANMIIQHSDVAKQSAPIISLTKSEPMPDRPNSAPVGDRPQSPIHCDCPTCTCPETVVNFGAGKIEAMPNQPLSHSTKLLSKPSQISGKVSSIPGKQSEKLIVSHQLSESPVPCDCPKCLCSAETIINDQKRNITEKVSRVTYKEPQISGEPSGEPSPMSAKTSRLSKKQSEKDDVIQRPKSPIPCNCVECSCPGEKRKVGQQPSSHISGKQSEKVITVHQSESPGSCNCAECKCLNEAINYYAGKFTNDQYVSGVTSTISGKKSQVSAKPSGISGKASKVIGEQQMSHPAGDVEETIQQELPERDIHPKNCNCPACCICPAKMEELDIAQMDSDTLKKEIQTSTKESCECREQIKEIKRALNKIKCACTEAEMKAVKNKPLVKQASAFGQTMSGLKLALNNLQEKCKAKDKMIDAMTGELKMRTSSNTFEKVLNTRTADVPDYDKAEDVKSFDKPRQDPISTNMLYPVEEEKDFAEKLSKAMANEKTHKSRKKSSRACGCGKPHKEKDNVKLTGFEVIDIRRITQDSIIVKWKPPKSSSVTGYDIFINGVNKSKVMSGGRTSAMIHSLDLSATIQVTIYAVTKCGRCEPPAIAIYEIRT